MGSRRWKWVGKKVGTQKVGWEEGWDPGGGSESRVGIQEAAAGAAAGWDGSRRKHAAACPNFGSAS